MEGKDIAEQLRVFATSRVTLQQVTITQVMLVAQQTAGRAKDGETTQTTFKNFLLPSDMEELQCQETFTLSRQPEPNVATFGGVTLYCTNIQRSIEGPRLTDQRVNVATLNQASGECMDYQPPGLIDCGTGGADGKITWTIDYYGTSSP